MSLLLIAPFSLLSSFFSLSLLGSSSRQASCILCASFQVFLFFTYVLLAASGADEEIYVFISECVGLAWIGADDLDFVAVVALFTSMTYCLQS